jgi:hypothetical protein
MKHLLIQPHLRSLNWGKPYAGTSAMSKMWQTLKLGRTYNKFTLCSTVIQHYFRIKWCGSAIHISVRQHLQNILYPHLSILVPLTSELLRQIWHNVLTCSFDVPCPLDTTLLQSNTNAQLNQIYHSNCPPEHLPLLAMQRAIIGKLNYHRLCASHIPSSPSTGLTGHISSLPIMPASTWPRFSHPEKVGIMFLQNARINLH